MKKMHNETFPYNVLMEEKGKRKTKERKTERKRQKERKNQKE